MTPAKRSEAEDSIEAKFVFCLETCSKRQRRKPHELEIRAKPTIATYKMPHSYNLLMFYNIPPKRNKENMFFYAYLLSDSDGVEEK